MKAELQGQGHPPEGPALAHLPTTLGRWHRERDHPLNERQIDVPLRFALQLVDFSLNTAPWSWLYLSMSRTEPGRLPGISETKSAKGREMWQSVWDVKSVERT